MVAVDGWRKRFSLFLVAALGLLLALGSVITASAGGTGGGGGGTGKIRACVDKDTGDVRIVKSKKDCHSDEKYIEWNTKGAAGEPGGLSGVEIVWDVSEPGENEWGVLCPEGKVATGGGGLAESGAQVMRFSFPWDPEDGVPFGWVAGYTEAPGMRIAVFAVCADMAAGADSLATAMGGKSLPFPVPWKP